MSLALTAPLGNAALTANPEAVPARAALDFPDALPVERDPAQNPFGGILAGVVDNANRREYAAATRVDALASGATDDIHGTMIAVREAEITTTMVASIRNKLLDAFHELWRTSV